MGCETAKKSYKSYKIDRSIPFIPGQWFPIDVPLVKVGLGWDFTANNVFDLDASVTAFDENNEPIESIYFGHLKGLNGSVKHYGDNLTGKGEGDDEVIKIELNRVPKKVSSLAVTINSYRKNSIIKAKNAFIRLFNGATNKEIGIFILNETKDCIGLLLGLFERNRQTGGWFFRVMIDPIEGNVVTKSYQSLKTLLNGYSESFYSSFEKKHQRHPLPGEPIFTPGSCINLYPGLIYIGLGWDILPGNIYDLDASVISFDNDNNVMEIIYHKNLKSVDGSIVHYGDNRTGLGEGDDEKISINLATINPNVNAMAVIVNSFKGDSMIGLKSAFIRLYDEIKLIGCHVIGQGTETTGLLLGLFRKDRAKNSWLFQVTISPLPGKEPPDSILTLKSILSKFINPSQPIKLIYY